VDNGSRINASTLASDEFAKLVAATPKSKALYERALKSLPQGVGSSFQAGEPYPIYLERGKGSHVWDVDGREYLDFHNGFGAMIVGHAHPVVAEAIEHAARNGTHFAAPTKATVEFAELLCERFSCESLRFANSGTEATMGAIRIARAATGRDHIVKIEGSYHGHHDPVMFSVVPNADMMGGRDAPHSTPMSLGIPHSIAEHTHVVPFNDLTVLSKLLDDQGDRIACLILEPVMMNIGICQPAPGYLQALKDLLHKHGALLIFDEVKSGATVAYGGAVERYGVVPDLACWAKAICGCTPGAAFGGRADVMDSITRGAAQQGTFNGNPLVAAAGIATLSKVMTREAYTYLDALGSRLASGCAQALQENGIPGHAVDLGAKGCVSYRPEPLTNYRDFLETDTSLYEASYPWAVNRGLFMTPGDEEQWTISVQHTESDIDRYLDQFAEFCSTVSGG